MFILKYLKEINYFDIYLLFFYILTLKIRKLKLRNTILGRFRLIGLIEGLSYLTLLFIAMPMKYMMGEPIYVKIVGMTHGILFIVFILAQATLSAKYKLSLKDNAIYFIASLIPFGTFFTDFRLKRL